MKKPQIFFLFLMFFSMPSMAVIWESEHEWDLSWEEKYREWVSSSKVHVKMFTDPLSPYYGVQADCADIAYAFRAIFSFEHKLPFAVVDPSAAKGLRKVFSHDMASTRFEKIKDSRKRLVAFINFLGAHLGTETLSRNDTFSLRIKDVSPGDLFMYKRQFTSADSNSSFVRHTFVFKGVDEFGRFKAIWSTQSIKAEGTQMLQRNVVNLKYAPLAAPWGFRRFLWPEHLFLRGARLPNIFPESFEQYELAKKMNERAFFKRVTQILATAQESPEETIKRNLSLVCENSQQRVLNVNAGEARRLELRGKCMDARDYDTYSTPARDDSLREDFETFKHDYEEALASGAMNEVGAPWKDYVRYIFDSRIEDDENLRQSLENFCPILYRIDPLKGQMTMNLRILRGRLEKRLLSSHPNDNLAVRWGENLGEKTKCKAYY